MKVKDLIERLQYAKCPDSEVYIAGQGDFPEKANAILFADENNSDGELAFMELGLAMGGLGVLIFNEDDGNMT